MGDPTGKDGVRILAVGSNERRCANIGQQLAKEVSYFDVRTETTVEDGVERTETEPIDIVVGIGAEEEIDGISLLRQLRATDQNVSFVLMAKSVKAETVQTVLEYGGQWLQTNGETTAMIPVLAEMVKDEQTRDRKAVSELEEAEERYETLVQTLSDIVFVTDYDSHMLFANDELERQTGLTVEDFQMEQESNPFIHPEDHERIAESIGQFAQSNRSISKPLDNRFIDKNGDVHWYTSRIGKVTYDGEPALQFVTHDITSRRGESDRSDERWHRSLLDRTQRLAKIGGYEYDIQTENLLWTDAMYDLLDFKTKKDPDKDGLIDYFHPSDQERAEAAFERAITEAEPFDLDAKIVTEDGTLKWVRFKGDPLPEDSDDVDRLRGALVDITDRKEYEQELEATKQTLEKSNEKLEQFAGIVSHDLRNPLNAAKLRLDFLREAGPEEHVAELEQTLTRMETMIEDLLTLSRTGATVKGPEQVSLATVVTESWDTAKTSDAEFEMEVPETVTIRADRDRLRHIYENLFRNAVDHNTRPVTLRVGIVGKSNVTDGDTTAGFFIEDDGDGIPKDERDEVLKDGYTTSDDGTGFGLSIVQDIVKAHDWDFTISKSESGGVRFEITNVELTTVGALDQQM